MPLDLILFEWGNKINATEYIRFTFYDKLETNPFCLNFGCKIN